MEENQKLVLSIVVVVVVLAVIGGGLYWDWKKLQVAETELGKTEKEKQELDKRISHEIPAMKEELESKKELVAEYEKTLPSATEIEAMDETLNNYKEQAGVMLWSRRPERQPAAPAGRAQVQPYHEYSYTISMKADFFAWVEFLRLLENHERFIRVDEFDVRVEEAEEEEEVLDITTKISTFSYETVQQPAAVGTAVARPAPAVGAR